MAAKSWVSYNADSEFPVENLPYGVFHKSSESVDKARCATRVGDFVVDLAALEKAGLFSSTGLPENAFSQVRVSFIYILFPLSCPY